MKFLVNPNPQYLSDILLDTSKIKMLMNNIFACPEVFEVGSRLLYNNRGDIDMPHQVDAIMSPLLFAFNNTEKDIKILVNDTPKIMHREHIVKQIEQEKLDSLMADYVHFLRSLDYEVEYEDLKRFDPTVMAPEYFIHPKVKYITETLR